MTRKQNQWWNMENYQGDITQWLPENIPRINSSFINPARSTTLKLDLLNQPLLIITDAAVVGPSFHSRCLRQVFPQNSLSLVGEIIYLCKKLQILLGISTAIKNRHASKKEKKDSISSYAGKFNVSHLGICLIMANYEIN